MIHLALALYLFGFDEAVKIYLHRLGRDLHTLLDNLLPLLFVFLPQVEKVLLFDGVDDGLLINAHHTRLILLHPLHALRITNHPTGPKLHNPHLKHLLDAVAGFEHVIESLCRRRRLLHQQFFFNILAPPLQYCLRLLKLAIANDINSIHHIPFLEQKLVSFDRHPLPAAVQFDQHLGTALGQLPYLSHGGYLEFLLTLGDAVQELLELSLG